jgi:hypothetical protein
LTRASIILKRFFEGVDGRVKPGHDAEVFEILLHAARDC